MNDLVLLKEEDIPSIIKEVETAFFDIPFGNSKFQTENFIVNAQYTPERAYRSIGLAITSKIQSLKETYYNRRKEDIDIEELKEKIGNIDTNKWDRKRFEVDLDQKLDKRTNTNKLINDAMNELSVLYSIFKQLPRYTREEFEAGEKKHFGIKLLKQASQITGAFESLENMGISLDQFGIKTFEVPNILDQIKPKEITSFEPEA